jgi:carbon catabolite-derepressing protein kinase
MAPAKKPNQVVIPGVGQIQEFIVDELAQLIDLTKGDVWLALKREGPNSIKVTYCLIRDEHRRHMGGECAWSVSSCIITDHDLSVTDFADEEREMQINQISGINPNTYTAAEEVEEPAISPPVVLAAGTGEAEVDPFEGAVVAEEEEYEYEEEEDEHSDEYEYRDEVEKPTFAVLHSSLVNTDSPAGTPSGPRPIVSSKTTSTAVPKDRKSKLRWHYGIRSRSPPLEVMLEIYDTLAHLGFQWREKKGPWGLKAPRSIHDLNDSIFHIETRCRVRDVVVRNFSTTTCAPFCLLTHLSCSSLTHLLCGVSSFYLKS